MEGTISLEIVSYITKETPPHLYDLDHETKVTNLVFDLPFFLSQKPWV